MANKRTYLREVNPYLACPLCRGYLIDATTVVECLHSFCRSCILKHLKKDAHCPSCNLLLNTAKPNIKADKTLQDIVYKLVPGLYHKEMRRRREFYSKHPEAADSATPEQRGEDVSGRLIFAPEDAISLSLEYLPIGADPLTLLANGDGPESCAQFQKQQPSSSSASSSSSSGAATPTEAASTADPDNTNLETSAAAMANKRYLQCPALVTIAHLKKFLALKYSVDVTRYSIDICHRRAPLPEHWTLMDVAYIFAWKRNAPIRFFYRITQEERLEAPPNNRPSTPGVGASQPTSSAEPVDNSTVKRPSVVATHQRPSESETTKKKQSTQQLTSTEPLKRQSSSSSSLPHSQKNSTQTSKQVEPEKSREMLAKRSTPVTKQPSSKTSEETSGKVHPVKSPIKIMKSPDGRYQVLSAPTPPPPPPPSAEFSVVKIGDGANSKGGVKITLKQCSPGSNSNSASSAKSNSEVNTGSSSKKPKVISNVLLRNSSSEKLIMHQMQQDSQKQDRQKRKVSFVPENEGTPTAKQQPQKKALETSDKKQFLSGFKLTTNRQSSATSPASTTTTTSSSSSSSTSPKKPEVQLSVEDQVKSIINKSLANRQQQQQQGESSTPVKLGSTNIAERLADSKQLVSAMDTSPSVPASKVSSNETKQQQQPIDVYAFPSEPPSPVPAGAVKRKCPPGLPIFEVRKRQQQYQPGKKAAGAAGTANRGGAAPKCYRNLANRPIFPKLPASPAASPARPLQKLPSIMVSPITANSATVASPPIVSSTSPKKKPLISDDTRILLDGCGLNIPPSLSITLTASKSPSRNEPPSEPRTTKEVTQHNPSITLNDKSVDPRVLKALKTGQIKVPATNAKTKGRQQSPGGQQGPSSKKKKIDTSPQPGSIVNFNGQKMEIQPLKIPTPTGKFKVKPPPTWSQSKSPSPGVKDDLSPSLPNGQVVTLSGGQRFYRVPPGSLTPAAHRIGDIPTPTRTPVYAPCFASPSSSPRPPPNFSSNFPTLQDLYALSQAPNLQQFHNDTRMRQMAAKTSKDTGSDTASPASNSPSVNVGKSHLAAQCPPVKPARSSGGTFAVPVPKQTNSAAKKAGGQDGANGKEKTDESGKGETRISTASKDSSASEQKGKKSEGSEKVLPKKDPEQTEKCASTTGEGDSHNGAASPRVTSTASPSPPPSVDEVDGNSNDKVTQSSKSDELVSAAEVTSSNKSPESPDSSSAVTEGVGNLVDSTKSVSEKTEDLSSTKNADVKSSNDEESSDEKSDIDSEFKKPMTPEALQERLMAAFPSNEWANNPIAAKQFGNILKTLSMQSDAQLKNAKTVE